MTVLKILEHFDEFVAEVREQLIDDDKRWGETYLQRTKEGQEGRTRNVFNNYFDKFMNTGHPINWKAVTGNAFICWLRETHPEMSELW